MHELGVQAPTSPCSSLDEPRSQLLGHTQEEAVSLPRQPAGRVPHREADIKRFSSRDIVQTRQGGIMRRMFRQLSGALLVTVMLGCGAGSAGGGSETATRASLQVIGQAPLTIQGHGFRSQERVRVSAAGRQWHPRASARGSFVLTLRPANRCNILRVVAVGSDGSHAVLRILPLRSCGPSP
jgi:hypothetical protein